MTNIRDIQPEPFEFEPETSFGEFEAPFGEFENYIGEYESPSGEFEFGSEIGEYESSIGEFETSRAGFAGAGPSGNRRASTGRSPFFLRPSRGKQPLQRLTSVRPNRPPPAPYRAPPGPSTDMESELPSFGSPDRTPRPVRKSFVSCHPPSAALKAVTGPDPVSVIQAANSRAIELLDYVIRDLEEKRRKIRAGKSTVDVVEDLPTRDALQRFFGMNADDRSMWTGSAAFSIRTLIRRLRGGRQILADGWMKYTCSGGPDFPLGNCRASCTPNDPKSVRLAVTCPGHSRIVLCQPWWRLNLNCRALVLLHEAIHIYFGHLPSGKPLIGDTGNFRNAHCYHRFVSEMNWLEDVGRCRGLCPEK